MFLVLPHLQVYHCGQLTYVLYIWLLFMIVIVIKRKVNLTTKFCFKALIYNLLASNIIENTTSLIYIHVKQVGFFPPFSLLKDIRDHVK